jgi:hypothetical protein
MSPDYSVTFLTDFFSSFAPELANRWHYRHLHQTSYGMSKGHFDHLVQSCDLFINVSGANLLPDKLPSRCIKVFLDTDPGYNQIVMSERFDWSDHVDRWCDSVAAHDRHFTYAENIHGQDCRIPTLGINWQTTRMPVLIDFWHQVSKARQTAPSPYWTTIMTWNAFKGRLCYQGKEYTSKGGEFERFMDLPKQFDGLLKVAIGGKDAPVDRLREHGWIVVDGPGQTRTANQYVRFINTSTGEFSVAKNVYVALRSGWFSCRSACYLAAGKPVVVQDTGLGSYYPTGEGLFIFETMEQAATSLKYVQQDYARHSVAAQALADEFFNSDKVLTRFVDQAMSTAAVAAPP